MRRADLVVLTIALSLGGFVAYHAMRTDPLPAGNETPLVSTPGVESPVDDRSNVVVVGASGAAAPARDVTAIRRRLIDHAAGTYIGDVLAARDSSIARWPDRQTDPITVWVDERSPLAGADQNLAPNVRRAFGDWGQAGIPLTFRFIADSAQAEVAVTFIDQFEQRQSGRTVWKRDVHWWIHGGTIQLSLRGMSGQLLNNDQLYAIALHEVGHLLGLDHASAAGAIMASRVRALALTPEDVATMRLIYSVPPGSVRAIAP